MTLPSFPVLPGQGWSVKKTPSFSTRVATHVSGREVRAANYAHGLYQFELTFEGLASDANNPGLMANSLQMLMDLYVSCKGQFGTFVYSDPTDCIARGQEIAAGDGVTATFSAQRRLIATNEPVSALTYINAVYVNGCAVTNYMMTWPNQIAFSVAPAAGSVITADFEYGWICRFLDDTVEFENFMQGLWSVSSLKFRSVR